MSKETVLKTRHVQKHDIEANWIKAGNAENPFIPLQGEIIVYDDRYKDSEGKEILVDFKVRYKIGDGIRNINDLPFVNDGVDQGLIWENDSTVAGTIYGYYKPGDAIYIPKTHNGVEVTHIYSFYYNIAGGGEGTTNWPDSVKIFIPDTVTYIASLAFFNDSPSNNTEFYCEALARAEGWDDRWNVINDYDPETGASGSDNYAKVHWGVSNFTPLTDSIGENSIAQNDATAVGKNSSAFGISDVKYRDDHSVSTSVQVIRGYNSNTEELIINTYGTDGPGSGSTSDLTPEEEPDADSVMYYKDDNQILSTFSIEFDSTGAVGENSFASGEHTLAAGKNSRASGWYTYAGANYTSTEGSDTIALGEDSHAEGLKNMSVGQASHTEGMRNTAEGKNSHVEGLKNHTSTNAVNSHVEGSYNNCRSSNTHIEGMWHVAIGSAAHSHIEGEENWTDAPNSHVEGYLNKISGSYKKTIDGKEKTFYGEGAHIEGGNNRAITTDETQVAKYVHIEGYTNAATAENAHAEGRFNIASGLNSHVEGERNTASGLNSHAEGSSNTIAGKDAHGEGYSNSIGSAGEGAHVGGINSIANGKYSFVHGSNSKVFSEGGVALGLNQFSRQTGSLSLGVSTQFIENLKDNDNNKISVTTDNSDSLYSAFTKLTPENRFSAAVGRAAVSLGTNNVAFKGISVGYSNFTSGGNTAMPIALGNNNEAKANGAVVIGTGNKTSTVNQIVEGKFNAIDSNKAYIFGIGTSDGNRKNAYTLDWDGNAWFAGDVSCTGIKIGNTTFSEAQLIKILNFIDSIEG